MGTARTFTDDEKNANVKAATSNKLLAKEITMRKMRWLFILSLLACWKFPCGGLLLPIFSLYERGWGIGDLDPGLDVEGM